MPFMFKFISLGLRSLEHTLFGSLLQCFQAIACRKSTSRRPSAQQGSCSDIIFQRRLKTFVVDLKASAWVVPREFCAGPLWRKPFRPFGVLPLLNFRTRSILCYWLSVLVLSDPTQPLWGWNSCQCYCGCERRGNLNTTHVFCAAWLARL